MSNCEQTAGQSVLQHGQSVWSYTQRILNKDLEGIKVPAWLIENYDKILKNVHDHATIEEYNVFHDCGKPYCLTVDKEGKRHFPNHAERSKEVWLQLGGNQTVANLIGWDMVLHTETAEEIKARNFSQKDAYTLLITAVAELNSNAMMFGGYDTISFKSKWKKLNRRGNMLLKEDLK